MNRYPKQQMANDLASHGRYGDSLLVHMNPQEVGVLGLLAPNGLTVNPVTGQPEAFSLKSLLPMIAGYAGSAALIAATGGAATPLAVGLAGGLSSGVTTGALTGDWERGIASGLIGGAVGGALGSAGTAASEAAAEGTSALTAEAGTLAIDNIGQEAGTLLGDLGAQEAAKQMAGDQLIAQGMGNTGALTTANPMGGGSLPAWMDMGNQAASNTNWLGDPSMSNLTGESYKEALAIPFQKDADFIGQLAQPSTVLPMAYGANELAKMDAEEGWARDARNQEQEDQRQREGSFGRLQAAYMMAQPNAARGYSPYRQGMSPNVPMYMPGYAAGGRVHNYSMDGAGAAGGYRGEPSFDRGYASSFSMMPNRDDYGNGKKGQAAYDAAMRNWQNSGNYVDPVTVQANLRGIHSVGPAPDSGFRPGFDPEFDYFQNDPDNVQMPDLTTRQQWQNMYRPFERITPAVPMDLGNSAPDLKEKTGKVKGMADGGVMQLLQPPQEPMPQDMQQPMPQPVPQAENPMSMQQQPQQGGEPSDQDIQALALALTGQAGEQADSIIQTFIREFGVEVFQEARQFILEQFAPNAQTEGMVEGQGDGMSDEVMGTIGGQQPVAVSPGEYILPADVVSGLGNGSSDAGAKQLDQLQERVRMARGGAAAQPPAIDPKKVMPL